MKQEVPVPEVIQVPAMAKPSRTVSRAKKSTSGPCSLKMWAPFVSLQEYSVIFKDSMGWGGEHG